MSDSYIDNEDTIDMIQLIKQAVYAAGLYGCGKVEPETERKVADKIMSYVEPKLNREDYLSIEEMISELVAVSEEAGFKAGFKVATLIVMQSLM